MGRRPSKLTKKFKPGDRVRYRPGTGTYGYEDALEADGRIPAIVLGHTVTRVRIKFSIADRGAVTRAVDETSLMHEVTSNAVS